MRLLTVSQPGGGSAAAISVDGVAYAIPDEEGRVLNDVGELLRLPDWRTVASAAAAAGKPLTGELRTRRPVLEPRAVVCVGINYRAHVLEMGRDVPTSQRSFPSCRAP